MNPPARIDANLVRNWGLAIGAAALGGSLTVASWLGEPASEPPTAITEQPLAGPIETPVAPPPAPAPQSAEQPPVTSAPVELSFLVRFQGSGPLGRAQALAEAGRDAEARRAAEAALRRQSVFNGLCFDRFTVGGAEMVLRVCAPVEASAQQATSADWLERLRGLSAVAYCEPNYVAEAEAR